MPRHVPALSVLLQDLGDPAPAAWAASLGISERTAWRWLRADEAPRCALLALYWVTRWGASQVDCEAYNRAQLALAQLQACRGEIDALRARLALLESIGEFGTANAPTLVPTLAPVRVPRDVAGAQQLAVSL